MEKAWCQQTADREAAERVAATLAKPDPADEAEIGDDEFFDPWELFPAVYGTYDNAFDDCALDVLRELEAGEKNRDDLGAEMFREMLCTSRLCDYGTSPRTCFPTADFRPLLPELIRRWEAYRKLWWED
ncbi:hypothetical protein [Roseibium alexandrii]|uniref:hypothetical protein n=1 Tax=Roseibium alexandrii TaxID=388408 RepID=UPI00375262D6